MPHMFSPQYLPVQQQQPQRFAPGFFSTPTRPMTPSAPKNITASPSTKHQGTTQQLGPEPQGNAGNSRNNSLTGKDKTNPPLSVTASPFVPLQVCCVSSQYQPSCNRCVRKVYETKVDEKCGNHRTCSCTVPLTSVEYETIA